MNGSTSWSYTSSTNASSELVDSRRATGGGVWITGTGGGTGNGSGIRIGWVTAGKTRSSAGRGVAGVSKIFLGKVDRVKRFGTLEKNAHRSKWTKLVNALLWSCGGRWIEGKSSKTKGWRWCYRWSGCRDIGEKCRGWNIPRSHYLEEESRIYRRGTVITFTNECVCSGGRCHWPQCAFRRRTPWE